MDFKSLEKKLNDDPKFREAFIKDPVGVLKGEGITLPQSAEESLRKHVKEATAENKSVPGSTVNPLIDGKDVGVGISIVKDF